MIIIAVIIYSGVDLPARSRLELSVQTQIQMNLWLPVNTHTLTHTHTYTLHFVVRGVGGERSSPLIYPVKKNVLLKIIS